MPPPHSTYIPSLRCHFAAVVVALLESVVGRPSFHRNPWSDASISTACDASASRAVLAELRSSIWRK